MKKITAIHVDKKQLVGDKPGKTLARHLWIGGIGKLSLQIF